MKTKSIKNIFVVALILFTVISCSKFEDGPKISFRSVMNRILGTYRIEYISKNGEDLTDYWNSYYHLSFKFSNDERSYYSLGVSGYIECNDTLIFYATGYQIFVAIDDTVTMGMNNYMIDTSLYTGRFLYPVFVIADQHNAPVFDIIRLTQDEMWLFLNKDGDEYEIKFKE